MSRKPHTRPFRDRAGRWRGANGRFLPRRSVVAVKAARTREYNRKAKERSTRERVKATKHGQAARLKTERRLTAAQVEARRREARRVTQKIRRAKKGARNDAKARPSFRSISSPRSKVRSKKRTLKRPPSTDYTIGKGDQFAAQIRVRFEMPAGFRPTQALVKEAIRYRIAEGEDAPRVRTKILRWRNPGRRMSEDRAWRSGNQPDAWNTLANVIRAALEA
jgi:hypothetical protein